MPLNVDSHLARPLTLPLDQIPSPLLVLDDEAGRLVNWSAAAAELFGLSPTALDQPVALLVPRHALPHWNFAWSQIQQRGAWAGELRLQTIRGQERTVHVQAARRPGGWVLAVTDLAERAAQETAARHAWCRRTSERLAAAAATEFAHLRQPPTFRQREFESLAMAGDTVAEMPAAHGFEAGAVLLVGLGPLVRECVRLQLEARGVRVVTAAEGFEALECLEPDRAGIRVLLIDADLPGWGASACITALRQREPLMPVVLLGKPEGQRIAAEIQAVIPKPFRIEEVLWGMAESQTAKT